MKNIVISIITICSLSALCAQTPVQIRKRLSSNKLPQVEELKKGEELSQEHDTHKTTPLREINKSIVMTPEGSLEVHIDSSARQALGRISSLGHPTEVMGYRVGFFFDNSQSARKNAKEAKDKFEQHFDVPVYMVYDSPYYKVSAGDCLSEDEALVLFERIRPIFPNAYVMRKRMEIKNFIIDESKMLSPLKSIDSLERESRRVESTNLLGN